MILGCVDWLAILGPNEVSIVVDLDEVISSLFSVEVGYPLLVQSRARALFEIQVLAVAFVEPVEEVLVWRRRSARVELIIFERTCIALVPPLVEPLEVRPVAVLVLRWEESHNGKRVNEDRAASNERLTSTISSQYCFSICFDASDSSLIRLRSFSFF